MSGGEIAEVADLKGIRVLKNEDDSPRIEYLVQWKDGSPDTWCAEAAAQLTHKRAVCDVCCQCCTLIQIDLHA
jgi:hypothetical protein